MKRILTLALIGCLVFTTVTPVTAIEGDGSTAPVNAPASLVDTSQAEVVPADTAALSPVNDPDVICVIVNDTVIDPGTPVQLIDGTSYVPLWTVTKALYPDAVLSWSGYRATVTAPGLTIEAQAGLTYFVANGRYLYLGEPIRFSPNNYLLLPARSLGAALGADVSWDPVGRNVVFTAGSGPIASADVAYNADDLYWLSHIIYAESGNQPLTGKIAVGNVVLNRVASSQFPNTVKSVIYQQNQFTPVANGTIYLTPNEESVIAAKLCLDGANTVGNALFFINPVTSRSSWVARNRTLITTIAQHAFYN